MADTLRTSLTPFPIKDLKIFIQKGDGTVENVTTARGLALAVNLEKGIVEGTLTYTTVEKAKTAFGAGGLLEKAVPVALVNWRDGVVRLARTDVEALESEAAAEAAAVAEATAPEAPEAPEAPAV